MRRPHITALDPPGGARAERYVGADLLDSYAVDLMDPVEYDIRQLADLALANPPASFRALMALRDAIMKQFGVSTSNEVRQASDGVAKIDFFPILAVSKQEIELGYDDVHLDFRAWLTLVPTPRGYSLQSTTVARAHNVLGRAYLAVIRPFHISVVKAGLRRAALG